MADKTESETDAKSRGRIKIGFYYNITLKGNSLDNALAPYKKYKGTTINPVSAYIKDKTDEGLIIEIVDFHEKPTTEWSPRSDVRNGIAVNAVKEIMIRTLPWSVIEKCEEIFSFASK